MSNDRIIQAAFLLDLAGAMVAWFGIVPLHARADAQQAETAALWRESPSRRCLPSD